jgi:DNA-binding Lrp family transcriptional regulator
MKTLDSSASRDRDAMMIIKELVENPRLSLSELSRRLGLNYLYVRRKLRSLISRGVISFSLSISNRHLGREVALIRIKGEGVERTLSALLRCNRVIVGFRVNSGEVVVVFISRSKNEVMGFIDHLKTLNSGIKELHIEIGSLDREIYIPLKNGLINCEIPASCKACSRLSGL